MNKRKLLQYIIDTSDVVFVKKQEATEYLAMLEEENAVMYAALLEAADLGKNAAMRCKVELQRIAKRDARGTV